MSDHPGRRLAGWILLAVAGLAVAVALSITASNLSTQPIGISGEPLRAGEKLAPANVTTTPKRRKPAPTQTASTPTTPTPATTGRGDADADDHGRNGGSDRDDD